MPSQTHRCLLGLHRTFSQPIFVSGASSPMKLTTSAQLLNKDARPSLTIWPSKSTPCKHDASTAPVSSIGLRKDHCLLNALLDAKGEACFHPHWKNRSLRVVGVLEDGSPQLDGPRPTVSSALNSFIMDRRCITSWSPFNPTLSRSLHSTMVSSFFASRPRQGVRISVCLRSIDWKEGPMPRPIP